MKHAPAFLTLLTISVGVFRVVAQTPSPMDLNRLGKWDEAVVAARRLLVPAAEVSAMAQRCETRGQLIYALGRLRRGGEARDEAATFNKECTALPADHWVRIAPILGELETTPCDLARISQMMLDGGRWRGRPVVPEAWIRASTERSQPFAEYGLLWWLNVPGGFAARGYLDTLRIGFVLVFPG